MAFFSVDVDQCRSFTKVWFVALEYKKERSRLEARDQSRYNPHPRFLATPNLNEMINVTPTTLNLLDLLTETIEKMK